MADSTVEEDGGGDFTTLAAALADAGTGNTDTITIQGAWDNPDTAACTVADNDITVQTDASSHHIGRPWASSETTYRHESTSGHSVTINGTGFTIDGVAIESQSTTSSDEVFRHAPGAASTFIAKNCVLGFASRNSDQDIFYMDDDSVCTINFENCHFYNSLRATIDLWSNAGNCIININSCSAFDVGFSASGSSRSGLVGIFTGAIAGYTYDVNIFNTFVEINTGVAVTFDGDVNNNFNLSVDRSITNQSAWHINADTFNDGDNTESATFADTTGASAVICEDLTTSPYDLRLQSHANNIAEDAHSDANMDNEVGGQTLSIPATDLVGTSRVAAYEIGAYTISVVGARRIILSLLKWKPMLFGSLVGVLAKNPKFSKKGLLNILRGKL